MPFQTVLRFDGLSMSVIFRPKTPIGKMLRIGVALAMFSSVGLTSQASACNYAVEPKNKAGQLHGKKLCFHDEARKVSTGFETYANGKLNGLKLVLHHVTGKPRYEWNYVDNRQSGVHKTFSDDGSGRIESEEMYRNDRQDGLQKYYFEGPDVFSLYRTTTYADGKEIGPETTFHKSGQRAGLRVLTPALAGYRYDASFYENGKLRSLELRTMENNQNLARIDYAVSGRIVKMFCLPPGAGYLYTVDECQKHLRGRIMDLAAQIK